MIDAFLRDWTNVVDVRPISKEDSFQSSPLKYTVSSNRHKYAGMDEESAERIRTALRESVPAGMK